MKTVVLAQGQWCPYRPSKEIKYLAEYYYFDENLNINDMGYMWRNDLSSFGLGFNYINTDFSEESRINSQSHNFDYWDENNSDNENLNEFYTCLLYTSDAADE